VFSIFFADIMRIVWSETHLLYLVIFPATFILVLQCHHGLWTRLEMLILWRVKMLSLPVLSKEHLGLKSGQFFKSHWTKYCFPILHGHKSLLPFLSRLWPFLLCFFHL